MALLTPDPSEDQVTSVEYIALPFFRENDQVKGVGLTTLAILADLPESEVINILPPDAQAMLAEASLQEDSALVIPIAFVGRVLLARAATANPVTESELIDRVMGYISAGVAAFLVSPD